MRLFFTTSWTDGANRRSYAFHLLPAQSGTLHPTTNRDQERDNASRALGTLRAGVHRMPVLRRIVSEAKADGKAIGYADGDTTVWKVEGRVGAKTS